MRILVAIPHYFTARGDGKYGSTASSAEHRVRALTMCLGALYQLFDKAQGIVDYSRRMVVPANQGQVAELDVVVCTTRGQHLLDRLPFKQQLFRHHATDVDPPLLGFECQAMLRDGLGRCDYYCYLEDDVALHDPWFFRKLHWFNALTDNDCLLQPYRYEVALNAAVQKLFLDGDLDPLATAPFQDVADRPTITGEFLGAPLRFVRPLNPHAGCYFLNQAQMSRWTAQPYFLDRDTRFVGPLESAATLGIMRTFRVYKPAPEHADFLAVQHCDTKFLAGVGGVTTWRWIVR